MFVSISTYLRNAKWLKWASLFAYPFFGVLIIANGYTFLRDHPGHRTGIILLISGSLFCFISVIEWLSRHLNGNGKIITNVVEIILVVTAVVLYWIA
jgi:hypothetical protein